VIDSKTLVLDNLVLCGVEVNQINDIISYSLSSFS
jgi:hypothetical protein